MRFFRSSVGCVLFYAACGARSIPCACLSSHQNSNTEPVLGILAKLRLGTLPDRDVDSILESLRNKTGYDTPENPRRFVGERQLV